MMQLLGPDEIAQAQPELVDQIHLVAGEVRSVRTEKEELVLTLGREDFEIKGRPRIRQRFPGEAKLAGLFGKGHLCRASENDGRRLQIDGRSQDAVPEVIGCDDGKTNGLAALFSHGESFREE